LKDPVGLSPDKHIYVERKAEWEEIVDGLPQFTKDEIRKFREAKPGA